MGRVPHWAATGPTLIAVLVACGTESVPVTSIGDRPGSPRPLSLTVAPAFSEIEAATGRVTEIRFRAYSQFDDGSWSEIPVAWSVDSAYLGRVNRCGLFQPSGEFGGAALVTAEAFGLRAEGRVGIRLLRDFYRGGLGPPDAEPFVRAKDPPGDSRLVFEAPQSSTIDRDGASFRWSDSGHARYRLLFRSASAEVSVYAIGNEVVLEADVWAAVALSNRGRPVRVELQAYDSVGDRVVRAAAPLELVFDVSDDPDEPAPQTEGDCE